MMISLFFQELGTVFRSVMKTHNLAPGDFPDLEPFRAKLQDTNFTRFPKLKPKMLEDLDEVRATSTECTTKCLNYVFSHLKIKEKICNQAAGPHTQKSNSKHVFTRYHYRK